MRSTLFLTIGVLAAGCASPEPFITSSDSALLERGEMIIYRVGQGVAHTELVDLGPPANLGATVLEGDPRLSARVDYATDRLTAGVFQATRGKALIHFPFTEHATILRGKVSLTDEHGNSQLLGPGDSYLVTQGSNIIWEVRGPRVQKVFFNRVEDAERPGPMVIYERHSTVADSDMIDLGPPETLGATVIEGDPRITARIDYGNGALTSGVFQATPGKALIDFPFTELATFHSGRVTLTDEVGSVQTLKPGDSYLIKQGSHILWDVAHLPTQKSFYNFVDFEPDAAELRSTEK